MSRFILCHLRTVRTVCYTGQTNKIMDNHVLSGVNQLNQKLHTPVKLTTDLILAMTRKARNLRHSHLRHASCHIRHDKYVYVM